VARIEFAPELADDLDRILDHLARHDSRNGPARIRQIVSAIDALADNPLIGRPVDPFKRELVIGRDQHGYLALYSYADALDTVFVLAIRSQREAGYADQHHEANG
jgi:toxin ParE1/3/4